MRHQVRRKSMVGGVQMNLPLGAKGGAMRPSLSDHLERNGFCASPISLDWSKRDEALAICAERDAADPIRAIMRDAANAYTKGLANANV